MQQKSRISYTKVAKRLHEVMSYCCRSMLKRALCYTKRMAFATDFALSLFIIIR